MVDSDPNADAVAKGLEGVTVDETRLSSIDGDAGELLIGGFPLEELAPNATVPETVFLLWNDRLPTESELAAFREDLAAHRRLPEPASEVVRAAGDRGVPAMDAVRMGVAAASLDTDADLDAEAAARHVVSRLPTIVATYWRSREGQDVLDPHEDLSHAGNYLYMLTGEEPTDAAVRGLRTYLNTVADHGLNASTFTARTIVSTESDLFSAITGAVGALKGPLHGGAPGPVLEMLLEAHESGDPEAAARERLDSGERLMGFGHRVYNVRDPRAAVLSSAAAQFYDAGGNEAFFEDAKTFERVGTEALEAHKPDASIHTNVEFYTAVLLYGIGIPRELFTATFAVSRVGGWSAHCLEQLDDNRLVRPRARYVGETDRTWTPIEER